MLHAKCTCAVHSAKTVGHWMSYQHKALTNVKHAIHVFVQGKGHGKVKLRMKYMSLEAIYSQPRTATVVCHTLLLKLTSPLLICAPPTLYVSTLALFCHCHCKLIHNRPWCCLRNLFTSSSLLTGLGSSASWQCPRTSRSY